eukprot:36801-Eustigmatos_ZCMA.PRE.1
MASTESTAGLDAGTASLDQDDGLMTMIARLAEWVTTRDMALVTVHDHHNGDGVHTQESKG